MTTTDLLRMWLRSARMCEPHEDDLTMARALSVLAAVERMRGRSKTMILEDAAEILEDAKSHKS